MILLSTPVNFPWTIPELFFAAIGAVPDPGSQDRDVVLVRRTVRLRKLRGVGNLEWGGIGEREVSLRATWGQGGRNRITPKEGLQVSEREWKGN